MSLVSAARSTTGAARRSVAVCAVLAVLSVPAFAAPASADPGESEPTVSVSVPGAEAVVEGSAVVGSVLAAVVDWPLDLTLTYQWSRDEVAVDGATSAEYAVLPSDVGSTFTVTVTGNGPGYDERVSTSQATAAVEPGTLTASAPGITGTAQVGATLTAVPVSWTPADTVTTYQWYVGDDAVEGATQATFVPRAEDLGRAVSLHVVGTHDGYVPSEQTTEATLPVVAGELAQAPVPTIVGTPRVGTTLTAVPGTWSPVAGLSYQWFVGDAAVEGETTSTFVPRAADLGRAVSVHVVGAADGYASQERVSVPTSAVVAGVFTQSPVPTISGTPRRVGTKLTAVTGTWAPGATFTYVWKAGSTVVGTASTFTPTSAHLGAKITVTVTATLPGYTSVTRTSAPTAAVTSGVFTTAPVPTLSGSVKVGSTVTAVTGTWAPTAKFTYQWRRNGAAISGATKSTYVPVPDDKSTVLTVTVSATRSGFVTKKVTSVGVKVGSGVFTTAPVPTISGTVRVGSTLKATAGTWSPAATVSYGWFRDGKAISGAGLATYVPTSADLGHTLTVKVTGRRTGFLNVTKVSASTVVVTAPFAAAYTPVVTGTVAVGARLRATVTAWVPAATLTYQWRANGVAIDGATSTTYVLTSKEYGKTISVAVTGTRTLYVKTTRTSASTAKVAGPVRLVADGMYRVGGEIAPGTYITSGAGDSCFWERRVDAGSSEEGVIGWDIGWGQRIVTILDTDAYFGTVGCGTWTRYTGAGSQSSWVSDGNYVVGVHMAPGTYATNGPEGRDAVCGWGVLNNFLGQDYTWTDGSYGYATVTLAAGDRFESYNCSWTRIG